jgi:Coenzyme PQQ synthesis protein D (PqqD)
VDDKENLMSRSAISYKLSPSASFRDLGEEGIVLMANTGQLYSTNHSGSLFIQSLQNGNKWEQAFENIMAEYDVERHILENDLEELVTYLISESVLIPTED